MDEHRTLRELPEDEAMRLLASVRVGRVVFTQGALPAIRPVNHLVVDGLVIFCTHSDSAVATQVATAPTVVAYEADHIDEERRVGWSVVVTGLAVGVGAGELADHYHGLLRPWVGRADNVVAVQPRLVTGFRMVPPAPDGTGRSASATGAQLLP